MKVPDTNMRAHDFRLAIETTLLITEHLVLVDPNSFYLCSRNMLSKASCIYTRKIDGVFNSYLEVLGNI